MDTTKNNELSPTALLSESVETYKSSPWTLLGISIAPSIVAFLVGFLFAIVGGVLFAVNKEAFAFALDFSSPGFIFLMLFSVVFGIAAAIIQLWSQIALVFAVKDPSLTVVNAYKAAVSKLKSYIWVTLLIMLIVLGGLPFFVIPALYFGVLFGMSMFVLVEEDLTGMQVLNKSKELINQKLGWYAWRLVVFIAILLLAYIPLSIITGSIDASLGEDVTTVTDIVSSIFSLVVTPLATIYFYKLYTHLNSLDSIKPGPSSVQSRWPWLFVVIGSFVAVLMLIALIWVPILYNNITSYPELSGEYDTNFDL